MEKKLKLFVLTAALSILGAMQLNAQTYRFTLLHTSDEHSVLKPLPSVDYHPDVANPARGGFARLAGLVNEIRSQKAQEDVLLLSSADYIGGSPYAWLILEGYSPEIELMAKIGYDATTIGNHEFDYGPDALAKYFLRAGYPLKHESLPIIASNLNIPDGHILHDVKLPAHKIFEMKNGLKVGVFGLLGYDAYAVAPYAEPVTVFDPVDAARKQVEALKAAGVDVIVALSHSGLREDREIAEKVENIDVILGGHDHYQTKEPEIIRNTILLHSSYYLQHLGVLELEYDAAAGLLSVINNKNNTPFQIPIDDTLTEDPEIREQVEYYTLKLNDFIASFSDNLFSDVNEFLMRSDFSLVKEKDLTETTVGNFVVDAMRLETEKVLNDRVDIAIQANGVIRGDIIPGSMPWSEGMVNFMDLVTISGLGSGPDQKAGYPMVSVYLTAQEVYNMLEIAGLLSTLMGDMYFLQISGLKYTYDPGKITWLTIPFANIPVPAYISVKDVKIYTGAGVQHEDGYEPLSKDDNRLFHLVSDYYLTSFLPMIGDILPKLALVLKNKEGEAVELDETIVYRNNREFKVWEAVARYAISLEPGKDNMPEVPEVYRSVQGRINAEKGIPLYVWSYLVLAGVVAGFGLIIRWALVLRKRKNTKAGNGQGEVT